MLDHAIEIQIIHIGLLWQRLITDVKEMPSPILFMIDHHRPPNGRPLRGAGKIGIRFANRSFPVPIDSVFGGEDEFKKAIAERLKESDKMYREIEAEYFENIEPLF